MAKIVQADGEVIDNVVELTEGTEVALQQDQAYDMFAGLLSGQKGFVSSLKSDTEDEKAALFNACSAPAERLKSKVGKQLEITDMLCHKIICVNEETGDKNEAPRIVLIDKTGKSYVCVSIGILSALEKIVGIYGKAPWVKPIIIEPTLVDLGKKSVLSLVLHPRK